MLLHKHNLHQQVASVSSFLDQVDKLLGCWNLKSEFLCFHFTFKMEWTLFTHSLFKSLGGSSLGTLTSVLWVFETVWGVFCIFVSLCCFLLLGLSLVVLTRWLLPPGSCDSPLVPHSTRLPPVVWLLVFLFIKSWFLLINYIHPAKQRVTCFFLLALYLSKEC